MVQVAALESLDLNDHLDGLNDRTLNERVLEVLAEEQCSPRETSINITQLNHS